MAQAATADAMAAMAAGAAASARPLRGALCAAGAGLAVSLAAALGAPAQAAERAIEKTVLVPASLDAVWTAWTTREGIVGFFAPDAVVEARPGGAFHVHIDPGAPPGMKGADTMRFMAVQPQRMLSFDWNAPPSLPQAREQRTLVILRFEAVEPTRTRLTLHHVGWGDGGEWDRAFTYFDRAWGGVLASLVKRFETGPVDWKPWLAQLEAARERARAAAAAAAAASAPR